MSSTLPYRADLDGLRGLSIVLVLMLHYFRKYVPGGFVGVNFFFILSGYLITQIVVNQVRAGTFSFRGFYTRRINRLFPALIVTLAGCVAAGFWVAGPVDFRSLCGSALYGALSLGNYFSYWKQSVYDRVGGENVFCNLWSLSLEEQFYLVFPLALYGLYRWRRWGRPYMMLWLLGFVGLSFLTNIEFARVDSSLNFYSTFSRGWELALGAVLAFILNPDWQQDVSFASGESSHASLQMQEATPDQNPASGWMLWAAMMAGTLAMFGWAGWRQLQVPTETVLYLYQMQGPPADFARNTIGLWYGAMGCLGIVLTMVYRAVRAGGMSLGQRHVLSWGGVVLMVEAILMLRQGYYPSYRGILPLAGALLFVAAGPQGFWNRTVFSHPWMVALGKASYCLFLLHWPPLSLLHIGKGTCDLSDTTLALVLLATSILAFLVHYGVEKPLRYAQKTQWVLAAMASVVVISALGFGGWITSAGSQATESQESLEKAAINTLENSLS